MKTTRAKLAALRRLMRDQQLDAYLVPATDSHLDEYVPECWQRRAWLSGFTGSTGDLLVMHKQAILWTDGRYFLQAEQELEDSGVTLFREQEPNVPELGEYLCKVMKKGSKLGVDPRVISIATAQSLRKSLQGAGATLVLVDRNLVDAIWTDSPEMPNTPIEVVPRKRAGESTRDKLNALRACMKERKADALVVASLDAVAWAFNVRSSDILYNPVVVAYGLVTPKGADLFVDPSKISGDLQRRLGSEVTVRPYGDMQVELRALAKRKARVWVDEETTNQWVAKNLAHCEFITERSPIAERKAKKNSTEIQGMRRAHVRDGVAMVRFLRWLYEEVPKGNVTELSAEARMEEIRSQGENYRGPSFRTIAAFGPHGAIVHYAATEQTNAAIGNGVFLFDTGGHYIDGTTDITRTVLFGSKPNAALRRTFTLVLKGHIALARTRFPSGVRGMRLDTLARMHLWNDGLDYNHGTGHGVGAFLCVHEGHQALSPRRCKGACLEAGNILSNEPGCYVADKYGLRVENLLLVVKDDKRSTKEKAWLAFETLTLCPIDRALVDPALLSPEEHQWFDDYHQRVDSTLSPLLEDPLDREWLSRACAPLQAPTP